MCSPLISKFPSLQSSQSDTDCFFFFGGGGGARQGMCWPAGHMTPTSCSTKTIQLLNEQFCWNNKKQNGSATSF